MSFRQPPAQKNAQGEIRKAGFELEFAGPALSVVAEKVRALFGGRIECEGRFCYRVEDTRFGKFSVESDISWLKNGKYETALKKVGLDPQSTVAGKIVEDTLASADKLLPSELVTPPIPFDELEMVDQLRAALCRLGAQGTEVSIFSAFGLHINPEVARLDADYLLSHLRAFFLLEDWITHESHIDLSRRLAPFIKPFPTQYRELVLDPAYHPSREQLIDDYMRLTPSRNRPLDMLPLFAHIDEKRVMEHAEEARLVKPRPTFHYRLPNCCVDDPDWRVAQEWSYWAEIESLAADPARISAMTNRYFELRQKLFARDKWAGETAEWLHAR